jgi:hypothetical protein
LATSEPTVVFLDANVIAKPVTRTLLMIGGVPSGYLAVWSQTAETEAERHLRDRVTKPSAVRARYGVELTPTGEVGHKFDATRGADRQILADAVAAGARYLVTEDVDDFAEPDLAGVGISAVNPDLFLAERMSAKGYAYAIATFVTTQTKPRRTGPQVHAAIAKQHPLLFAAHAGLYDVEPKISPHEPPAVTFRGRRCLRCETVNHAGAELTQGLCEKCRAAR